MPNACEGLGTIFLASSPANSQHLFQDLLRHSQSGIQPPGIPSPALQQEPLFTIPGNDNLRPDSLQRQPAPTTAQAEARPEPYVHEQQRRQVPHEPTAAGPQRRSIGCCLQLVTASAPLMAESELHQQANHSVNAPTYGPQTYLDLWDQHLVMAFQQCNQWQQQQAQQMHRQLQQHHQQRQQQQP